MRRSCDCSLCTTTQSERPASASPASSKIPDFIQLPHCSSGTHAPLTPGEHRAQPLQLLYQSQKAVDSSFTQSHTLHHTAEQPALASSSPSATSLRVHPASFISLSLSDFIRIVTPHCPHLLYSSQYCLKTVNCVDEKHSPS